MTMKKAVVAVLILLALLTVCAAAGAATHDVEIEHPDYGIAVFKYRLDDETKTAMVLEMVPNMIAERIPGKVTWENVEYTVTEIADNAFARSYSISDLLIAATVTRIGREAFQENSFVREVKFEDNS